MFKSHAVATGGASQPQPAKRKLNGDCACGADAATRCTVHKCARCCYDAHCARHHYMHKRATGATGATATSQLQQKVSRRTAAAAFGARLISQVFVCPQVLLLPSPVSDDDDEASTSTDDDEAKADTDDDWVADEASTDDEEASTDDAEGQVPTETPPPRSRRQQKATSPQQPQVSQLQQQVSCRVAAAFERCAPDLNGVLRPSSQVLLPPSPAAEPRAKSPPQPGNAGSSQLQQEVSRRAVATAAADECAPALNGPLIERTQVLLPCSLRAHQRAMLHCAADALDLTHVTSGEGRSRRLALGHRGATRTVDLAAASPAAGGLSNAAVVRLLQMHLGVDVSRYLAQPSGATTPQQPGKRDRPADSSVTQLAVADAAGSTQVRPQDHDCSNGTSHQFL